MRVPSIAFLVAAACVAGAACGGGDSNIVNLPLRWQGVEALPRASGSVGRALSAAPFALGLRDLRPDPTAVGTYQDTGFVVRTTDNVGQFCSDRLGEMLVRAGARLEPGAPVTVEADLLDYQVVEGKRFVGTVRMRTTVKRGASTVWSKTYTGSNERWGRTHNPENFNEALSNSLADAAQQLLQDNEFAKSLGG
ncbi:MAG TPA: YajG family lipoprotein [Kofleriaceae bacterium]